ncbi:uncharacterized protein TNCV_446231 [Trichonephila clavipes]|nr:uncharacterized protein TNCV_446231 [Trichonephila clavipes]
MNEWFSGRAATSGSGVTENTSAPLQSQEYDTSTAETPPSKEGRSTLNMLRLKCLPVGVVGKLEDWGASSGVVVVTCLWLKITSCQVIYSQFGLEIHQNDHQARHRFVEWAQNEIAVVRDFHKRILFSDEAHFSLNGYVNKQNCRIWSEANPQVYVEPPLHPEKLTVWCALWAGGTIGPYFFKNDESHNVTVNGDRYRAMITNFSFLN